MKRLLTQTALGIAAVLSLVAVPAYATAILTFTTGTATNGGSIAVSGGNATGSNIPYESLVISGAPADNGTFALTGTAAGSTGAFSFDTAADTFSLIGGIPSLGIASGTLISGTLTSSSIPVLTASTVDVTYSGTDTLNSSLLAALGLAPTVHFNISGFEIGTSAGGSPYTATSSSLTAMQAPAAPSVPEPSSVVLLSGGMLMGLYVARKKLLQIG